MIVICRASDGSETDITEGVQTLYDMVIGSMDWGSGFLTAEDALPVVQVAKTCGFKDWQRAQDYVDDMIHSQEQARFQAERRRLSDQARALVTGFDTARGMLMGDVEAHDHVFSSVGRCMWPCCRERSRP